MNAHNYWRSLAYRFHSSIRRLDPTTLIYCKHTLPWYTSWYFFQEVPGFTGIIGVKSPTCIDFFVKQLVDLLLQSIKLLQHPPKSQYFTGLFPLYPLFLRVKDAAVTNAYTHKNLRTITQNLEFCQTDTTSQII